MQGTIQRCLRALTQIAKTAGRACKEASTAGALQLTSAASQVQARWHLHKFMLPPMKPTSSMNLSPSTQDARFNATLSTAHPQLHMSTLAKELFLEMTLTFPGAFSLHIVLRGSQQPLPLNPRSAEIALCAAL